MSKIKLPVTLSDWVSRVRGYQTWAVGGRLHVKGNSMVLDAGPGICSCTLNETRIRTVSASLIITQQASGGGANLRPMACTCSTPPKTYRHRGLNHACWTPMLQTVGFHSVWRLRKSGAVKHEHTHTQTPGVQNKTSPFMSGTVFVSLFTSQSGSACTSLAPEVLSRRPAPLQHHPSTPMFPAHMSACGSHLGLRERLLLLRSPPPPPPPPPRSPL